VATAACSSTDATKFRCLDSFENPTYPDGQATAIYGQSPPLVNASRKPGRVADLRHRLQRPTLQRRQDREACLTRPFSTTACSRRITQSSSAQLRIARSGSMLHIRKRDRSRSRITAIPCASETFGFAS
jgi:hypothetical protein